MRPSWAASMPCSWTKSGSTGQERAEADHDDELGAEDGQQRTPASEPCGDTGAAEDGHHAQPSASSSARSWSRQRVWGPRCRAGEPSLLTRRGAPSRPNGTLVRWTFPRSGHTFCARAMKTSRRVPGPITTAKEMRRLPRLALTALTVALLAIPASASSARPRHPVPGFAATVVGDASSEDHLRHHSGRRHRRQGGADTDLHAHWQRIVCAGAGQRHHRGWQGGRPDLRSSGNDRSAECPGSTRSTAVTAGTAAGWAATVAVRSTASRAARVAPSTWRSTSALPPGQRRGRLPVLRRRAQHG